MSRPLRFEYAHLLYINSYGVSGEQKPRLLCRFKTIDRLYNRWAARFSFLNDFLRRTLCPRIAGKRNAMRSTLMGALFCD